jgi:hypothetical protein
MLLEVSCIDLHELAIEYWTAVQHEFDERISSYLVYMMRILVRIDILYPSHNSQQNTELIIIAGGGHLTEKLSSWDKLGPWYNRYWLKPLVNRSLSSRFGSDPNMTHEQCRPSESAINDQICDRNNNTVTPSPTEQLRCWSGTRGYLTVTPGCPLVKVFQYSEGGSCGANVSIHNVKLNISPRQMVISGWTFSGNDNLGIWHNWHWLQPPMKPPFRHNIDTWKIWYMFSNPCHLCWLLLNCSAFSCIVYS